MDILSRVAAANSQGEIKSIVDDYVKQASNNDSLYLQDIFTQVRSYLYSCRSTLSYLSNILEYQDVSKIQSALDGVDAALQETEEKFNG